jgi:hypothetical protein
MANWLLRLVWLRLNIVYNFAEVKTADAPGSFRPCNKTSVQQCSWYSFEKSGYRLDGGSLRDCPGSKA